jgi:hypothetical protein
MAPIGAKYRQLFFVTWRQLAPNQNHNHATVKTNLKIKIFLQFHNNLLPLNLKIVNFIFKTRNKN